MLLCRCIHGNDDKEMENPHHVDSATASRADKTQTGEFSHPVPVEGTRDVLLSMQRLWGIKY